MLLKRHALDLIVDHLGVFRVIAITGARQVGKSTLARMVLDRVPGTYLTLDDPLTLERATRDPDGLVASRHGLLVIDEVQRAPDLLRAIKLVVDRDPSPGGFLITGSANLLGLRHVTESLAGRAIYLELLPLSWSEIVGAPPPTTIDDAFASGSAQDFLSTLRLPSADSAAVVRERALAGGMPEAYGLDAGRRWRWYQSYRTTFLERDLRQLSEISNVPDFNRLTSLALLRSAGLLNKSDLAVDAQLSRPTVDRYLNILQIAYQIRLLYPYFANPSKRLVKSPRLYAVDSGAAAWAANAVDWRAAAVSGREGSLLETFAVSDIIAWDGLSSASRYSFWRTSAGAEVDLVIERGETVVGIEFKSASGLRWNDLSGLRALRGDLGPRFKLGIVANLGVEAREVDDRIVAVPLASLLGVGAFPPSDPD
ncbi:MAG: ATP-binding protein, partial [Actinobacteria bacterium]|nr:ATP-binding protein [Actinomycetota bacterium]